MPVFLKLLPGGRIQDRKVTEEVKLKYMFDTQIDKKRYKGYQKQDIFLEGRELMEEGQTFP